MKFNLMISMRIQISVLFCLTLITIHGCTIFRVPQLRNDETAHQCLKRIADINDLLVSCKGIAKISAQGFEFQLNERIAFISQKSHKFRAEMLSPFGVIGSPFKLICNQNQIYLNCGFLEKPIYTHPGALLLKYALPIQIQSHELIAFLHGQLPITPEMHATFDPQNEQKILLLSQGLFRKTGYKIIFNLSATQVLSFEKYNHFNKLIYRVTFYHYQMYKGFSIPSNLTISNDKNQSITIDMQSYYPNCAILNKPFQIESPGRAEKGGFPCVISWILNPIQSLFDMF